MSNNTIIKAMGISKTTFYRYIKELKSFGIISEIEDGLSVSTELFPIYQTGKQGIEAFKETLDKTAEVDSNFKYNRIYKEFYRHYDTGFKNLHMPLKDFPESLESGVFFLPSKKEKVPKIRQIEFSF